jgi:hypothetical protein
MTDLHGSDRNRTLRCTTQETTWSGWVLLRIVAYASCERWYEGIVPVEEVANETAIVAARHARVLAEEAVHRS